jgi:pimeloyl-ACP methyl ester carboxylesterase
MRNTDPAATRRNQRQHPTRRRTSFAVAALVALIGSFAATTAVGAEPPGTSPNVVEDAASVPVDPIPWHACGGSFECARVKVPLDHDEPTAKQISLAVIRIPAADPAHRIGSLFVNPGGPGNSGVDFVREDALSVLPAAVHDRFDIVGFDPRGVARSTPFRCFNNVAEQQNFFAQVPAFPVGAKEEARYAESMRALGATCAVRNPELIQHLSTANVARDLDLLRQAVGDTKLSYAGFSYGTFLGETYASLFPGRVRVLELDGVVDPVAWTTGRAGRGSEVPFSLRVGSARATSSTLGFFLRQCQQAGAQHCAFASAHTTAKFDRLMNSLLHKAVVIDAGQGPERFTYADVVDAFRGSLQFPPIWSDVASLLQAAHTAAQGETTPQRAQAPVLPESYDNSREVLLAVACGETDNPSDPAVWPRAAHLADKASPYFGADWAFLSQACATWPAADQDRYAGPFFRETSAPALLVNAKFDAASLYRRAKAVERRMPGAQLLTLDGAGHPASFMDNPCIDKAVARYLIHGALPGKGATCGSPGNPFGG